MTLVTWGRGVLLWSLVAAAIAISPLLLLQVLPGEASAGFFGILAVMLSLSVVPLALIVASVGAILLLVGVWQRGRP